METTTQPLTDPIAARIDELTKAIRATRASQSSSTASLSSAEADLKEVESLHDSVRKSQKTAREEYAKAYPLLRKRVDDLDAWKDSFEEDPCFAKLEPYFETNADIVEPFTETLDALDASIAKAEEAVERLGAELPKLDEAVADAKRKLDQWLGLSKELDGTLKSIESTQRAVIDDANEGRYALSAYRFDQSEVEEQPGGRNDESFVGQLDQLAESGLLIAPAELPARIAASSTKLLEARKAKLGVEIELKSAKAELDAATKEKAALLKTLDKEIELRVAGQPQPPDESEPTEEDPPVTRTSPTRPTGRA